jgi:hypothetical protein
MASRISTVRGMRVLSASCRRLRCAPEGRRSRPSIASYARGLPPLKNRNTLPRVRGRALGSWPICPLPEQNPGSPPNSSTCAASNSDC